MSIKNIVSSILSGDFLVGEAVYPDFPLFSMCLNLRDIRNKYCEYLNEGMPQNESFEEMTLGVKNQYLGMLRSINGQRIDAVRQYVYDADMELDIANKAIVVKKSGNYRVIIIGVSIGVNYGDNSLLRLGFHRAPVPDFNDYRLFVWSKYELYADCCLIEPCQPDD